MQILSKKYSKKEIYPKKLLKKLNKSISGQKSTQKISFKSYFSQKFSKRKQFTQKSGTFSSDLSDFGFLSDFWRYFITEKSYRRSVGV